MTERPLAKRISAHYDETWGDYRWIWLSPRSYAIHSSYCDEMTRTHAQSLRDMSRTLAGHIGVRPRHRILDAGSGSGGGCSGQVGGSAWSNKQACAGHCPRPPTRTSCVHGSPGGRFPTSRRRTNGGVWVSAAGFDGIEISNNTPHVLPSRRRLYWMTQALWPGASLLWHIGMRSETQHGNTRGAREIYRAARRGLWRERILTATAR